MYGKGEEIRLSVENVKYKKVEGTLYLMSERIAWIPKNQDVITTSYHYADIKMHKISTEGKSKVQLQIIMHDDSSATFHFINSLGQGEQLKDRDKVKEQLCVLLPKFKQKVSRDLEEKKRILIENPQLYQLYNDIVVTPIISSEDFWKYYADIDKAKSEGKPVSSGVAQGFLSNICPKSDGTNVTYNLSFDDIQSIFKTYPSVRQKYLLNVPHKVSEVEFWTKFFQSHYFHRDRLTNSTNDLFSDCVLKDEEDLKQKAKSSLSGQTIIEKDDKFDEGFGLSDFNSNVSTNLANQNLIKRYNYYSIRILSAMQEYAAISKPTSSAAINTNETKRLESVDESSKTEPEHKRRRLDDEIDDLLQDDENTTSKLKGRPLNLIHIERYFNGPSDKYDDRTSITSELTTQESVQSCRNTLDQMMNWSFNLNISKNSNQSLSILKELSPGGELMSGATIQNLQDEIPKAKQEEMKALYVSVCELLRHFWACFPPTTNELEKKFDLMKDALDAFQQNKIHTFRDRLLKDNFSWDLTSHLDNLIKIANAKYINWNLKRKFANLNTN